MNHLLDLITPNNIIFHLEANSKEEVIRKLVEHAIVHNMIKIEFKDEIILSLMKIIMRLHCSHKCLLFANVEDFLCIVFITF